MATLARLCVFGFDSTAAFDGELVSALERMEVRDGAGLLDALFVTHDVASGAVVAVDMGTAAADGTFASLLDFRLDPSRRMAISRRTLSEHRRGVPPRMIREIAATLDADAAILVVLHSGDTPTVLCDAVERCRGRSIGEEPVDAATIGPLRSTVSKLLAG
jgi:hypothetical protein